MVSHEKTLPVQNPYETRTKPYVVDIAKGCHPYINRTWAILYLDLSFKTRFYAFLRVLGSRPRVTSMAAYESQVSFAQPVLYWCYFWLCKCSIS